MCSFVVVCSASCELIYMEYKRACTVIVEIFGGFNFGHFRISPEFLISGGI